MTDRDTLQAVAVDAPAEEVAPIRHRATFSAPDDDPIELSAPSDEQEHHPVTDTLIASAPPLERHLDGDTPAESAASEPAPELIPAPASSPRPASVPSHRADVEPVEVIANDATEPRPASAARHSTDTSAITLPVFPAAVDPSLPQPPERLTLDDDDLVRIIERRFDDTAAVDLLAVVQAQLSLRAEEAARFASWENEISRIDSAEAATALEQTRLRFTGIVPVQSAAARPVADVTPEARVDDATPVAHALPDTSSAPADTAAAAPVDIVAPNEDVPGELGEPGVTDVPVTAGTPQTATVTVTDEAPARIPAPRLLVLSAAAAGAIVLLAVVLALAGVSGVGSAVLATVAVPLAAALAGLAALQAVASRPSDAERVARRGPIAVVVGVVLGSVVGCGVLVSPLASFAWQGYLVRLVGFSGVSTPLGVVFGVIAAAAVSFVVAVLITGLRSASRVATPRD
ncbi:hypothetical protein ACPEEZ_08130 [Frigoribacterium sp. 2-23]|uniref:hypothetical protein n=1 Tax=Frigoribacterium sp. 2-23 TaxID=3415006 RepID=UPI003C6FA3E5